jgi:hypothetical protein
LPIKVSLLLVRPTMVRPIWSHHYWFTFFVYVFIISFGLCLFFLFSSIFFLFWVLLNFLCFLGGPIMARPFWSSPLLVGPTMARPIWSHHYWSGPQWLDQFGLTIIGRAHNGSTNLVSPLLVAFFLSVLFFNNILVFCAELKCFRCFVI